MYPNNRKKIFLKNNNFLTYSIDIKTIDTKLNDNKDNKKNDKEYSLKTEFYWEILKQKYPYDSNKKYCVFFNGGCCPPHKGHIESIKSAMAMLPGCKVIINQLGSSKRHGVPSKYNSELLKKYLSVIFGNSPDIHYMFRATNRQIFTHEFVSKSDVLVVIRGEEFEDIEQNNIIIEINKLNEERFKKYIKKLNDVNIKIDFYLQSRQIDKISATKFMECLDNYKYKQDMRKETKNDFFTIMDFIPDEISFKDKYKIVKKLLSFNTYATK